MGIPLVDHHAPFAGPCLLCGRSDSRHRLFIIIRERHRAHESIQTLAKDYDLPTAVIRTICRVARIRSLLGPAHPRRRR
jgi:hypothetical protein